MLRSKARRAYPDCVFKPDALAIPVVTRARLLSRIIEPEARKVTVIAAPLGYGKTVLLTQAHDAFTKQGRCCLWLSVDKAFGGELPDLLCEAADRAGIPAAPPAAITLNSLLTRIECHREPVTIFIDSFNQNQKLEDALCDLIRASPRNTSFLVATETELLLPLVRLEAAGLLRRIGAAELAFEAAEIEALGELTALPGLALTLTARSEGWPAIVQLALSRCRECPDLAPLPLSGTQRDIAAFLEQEVLAHLDGDVFGQLLDASVAEQICGSLLNALSGRGDGLETLNALVRRGVPMQQSRSGEWFRLHPLLREYLYDRLQRRDAGRLALLHRRAANWLLTFGDEHAALRHGTASGDIDFLRTIYQDPTPTLTLSPDYHGRVSIEERFSLMTCETTSQPKWDGIMRLIRAGQIDLARQAIAKLEMQRPIDVTGNLSTDRAFEWELTYIDLLMRVFDDRLPSPDRLETLRDQLMRTPGVPLRVPAAVSELIIVARFRWGDLSDMAKADQDLWHTSALAPPQSKIYLLIEMGIAAMELGDLDLAVRHFCSAKTLAIHAFGLDAAQARAASTLLAELAYERGDVEAGAQQLEQSFCQMKHDEIWFNLAASAFTTGAALAAGRGWDEVLSALELPRSLAVNAGLWRLPPLLVAQRLRLAVLAGQNLETVRNDRAALSSLGLLNLSGVDSPTFGWRVSVPAQLAVIRFDLADRKAEAALARAAALRPALEARRHVRRLIELNLLQGRALMALGDRDAGLAMVRAALSLSANSGMIQSFLDEMPFLEPLIGDLLLAENMSPKDRALLCQLLTRLGRPPVAATRYLVKGRSVDLSSREAQLLQAMATGQTFKEISFALNISINTTKMHRARLYRKLGCNSRSQAATMAQEMFAAGQKEGGRAGQSQPPQTGLAARSLRPEQPVSRWNGSIGKAPQARLSAAPG